MIAWIVLPVFVVGVVLGAVMMLASFDRLMARMTGDELKALWDQVEARRQRRQRV